MNTIPDNEHFCLAMLQHYTQRLQKRVVFCSDDEYAYLMSSLIDYQNRVAAMQVQSLIREVNKQYHGPSITI